MTAPRDDADVQRQPSGHGQTVVPFRAAVRAWFLISLQTFGGPAGQIAVMQRTLVDEHRWIGQRRFLHAMNYCMLLPGPEAQQLATYVGWLLHGTRGGLVAGGLFVLPGVVALLVLSAVYVAFGDTTAVLAVFAGLAPAVLAIVAQAVQRVAKRALDSRALAVIAVAAFLALNWHLPGMWLAALGFVLNVVVIAVNQGMPVSREAAEIAGFTDLPGWGIKHEPLDESTILPWIADVIPIPGLKKILSIGDVALAAGIGWLVYKRTVAEDAVEEQDAISPEATSG